MFKYDTKARVTVGLVLLFLIGFSLGFGIHVGHADYDNIRVTKLQTLLSGQAVAASGTYTTSSFKGLERMNTQSVQFRNTGTSPNYKVEVLVNLQDSAQTLDSTYYAKPEIGGDLGTYTDQNWHVMPLTTPFCGSNKLKFTELGAANAMALDALEKAQ